MGSIPDQVLDTTVAIGAPGQTVSWIASGFLYGLCVEEPELDTHNYMVFLVTNRHVFDGRSEVLVRFNPTGGEPPKDYPLTLEDGSGINWWFAHPDPEVDIAVTPLDAELLLKDDLQFEFFRSHDNCVNRATALAYGIGEGDSVFILGFPMALVGEARNYVVLRGGVIARARDAWSLASNEFLVDASVFPGNSGGPVIMAILDPGPHVALIGVVSAYLPYRDVAISQQTGQPRVIFEENSGLAAVHPVDLIEDTARLASAVVPVRGIVARTGHALLI